MSEGFSQMVANSRQQTALNQQTQDSITRLEQRIQSQEMAMERLQQQLASHEAFQKDWNAKITEKLTKVEVDSMKREKEMMDRFNEGFYGSKAKRKEEEDSDGGGWMGWAAAALATAAGVAAYTLKE
jgi:predicted secreted protein